MSGWSLDKTAERFDELQTQMTGFQRRLIEAVRSGDESDPRTRELEEARTVIAACDTAAGAITLGYATLSLFTDEAVELLDALPLEAAP